MPYSRDEMLAKARAGVQKELARKDLLIIQAIRSLDDIDEAKSLLYTRLLEWFHVNFPEFALENEDSAMRIIAEFADRKEFDAKKMEELIGKDKATHVMEEAENSYGAIFDKPDRDAISALADRLIELNSGRKEIEAYIVNECRKEMPNLCELVEPLLAARLISISGGLRELAMMPASTIQVIGAEKALFKHLRKGTLPPKHGVIFQSAFIRGAPFEQRGRIARDLSTKLAIAVKADAFTGNFIAPMLKQKFEKRLKEIRSAKIAPKRQIAYREIEYERNNANRFRNAREWSKTKSFKPPQGKHSSVRKKDNAGHKHSFHRKRA